MGRCGVVASVDMNDVAIGQQILAVDQTLFLKQKKYERVSTCASPITSGNPHMTNFFVLNVHPCHRPISLSSMSIFVIHDSPSVVDCPS